MLKSQATDGQHFWREVYRLVDEASALPAAQRAPYLDEVCDDLQVRVEVQRIVELIDDPEQDSGHWAATPAAAQTPERVGQYRLIKQIGSGGMAEIFLAERDDGQFQHRVALKLIRVELDNETVRKRFLAERQILASLRHPNIAQLLDGGLADDGRPYFALELVEGAPLLLYCDEQRLPIADRIRMFLAVCSAVQYAHGKLVVHRDLKPSNLLVTELGRPKLLDFGIAKLLSGAAAISMLRTPTGVKLMTPEYAAPEQFRGEEITVATDVHALGLLLYELLTGHRAYVAETRTPWDVGQVVLNSKPKPMGDVVGLRSTQETDDGELVELGPGEICAARVTTLPALRKLLRGDLQHIVDRALAKLPDDRYPTVESLALDLQRFLDDEPVSVRQGEFGYESRKFVGRHKLAALGVAMFVVGGLAGLVMGNWPSATQSNGAEITETSMIAATETGSQHLERGRQAVQNGNWSTASEQLVLAMQYLGLDDESRQEYLTAQLLLSQTLVEQRQPEQAAILIGSLLRELDSGEAWVRGKAWAAELRKSAQALLARTQG